MKLDDDNSANSKEQNEKSKIEITTRGFNLRALTALILMMTIFSVTEWQYKSLSYYYGFQGVGDKFGDPKYEMSSDFTQMHDFYGLMSGIVYDLPYAFLVLAFAGFSKSKQRVPITAWFMIL